MDQKSPWNKDRDRVADVKSQRLLSVGNANVCFNFIPSQEVGRMEGADFFQVRLVQ